MQSIFTLFFFLATAFTLSSQEATTDLRVYEIFQSKCANCHSNANPRGGLNLEGSGNTAQAKLNSIYGNLINAQPNNATAKAKGYSLIHPGRADKSFLFKKINQGLDSELVLESGEKDAMPLSGSLTDVEKELIRQWILFGAPKNKLVVKEEILQQYYEEGRGQSAFPDGPPTAPDPSEGFQIKMGPFFIGQGGEDEYFSKYQLDNTEPFEVNRLDIKMSNFSHHFIIYDYEGAASEVPAGFRRNQNHTEDVSFVATVQETQNIALPRNTAFKWGRNHVLDLNSHTINYVADGVYLNEVYINVYTQPDGTAKQEMQADLVPYFWINIPNNGNEITHSNKVRFPGKAYIWNLTGHTHQYGTSYKIWMNDEVGRKDELIYDASCPRGIPGCVAPFYDYQHIPTIVFDEFLPIDFANGITHEAKWVNDGPASVRWGPTSNDEMMLFAMLYVEDTTGLGINAVTTSVADLVNPLADIEVMPNPMKDQTHVLLPNDIGAIDFRLIDMLGKEILQLTNFRGPSIEIQRNHLPGGMYLFRVENKKGQSYTGKILMK